MSENVPQIQPVKIQIKKNQGISQALKKLVEDQKMELTDGKITASEWNAVLDKLIEIQHNRKANGQASIFGGGTDKTKAGWHSSFVVHPNQEIEFTAEEIGSLYEAMGASFTKSSTPVAPPKSNTDPVEAPDKKGEGNKADNGGTEEVKTDENGNEYTAQIKDGKEIKRTYNDDNGTYTVAIEYGNDGKKTKEVETQYDSDKTDYIREYDKNGNLKSATCYEEDGKTVRYINTYEYDSAGKKTKETRTRGDGTLDYVGTYENGKEMTTTFYEEDGKTVRYINAYEYDSAGNMTKEIRTLEDGSLYIVKIYENGEEKSRTYYDTDGKTPRKIIENGQLKMVTIETQGNEGQTEKHKYEFNENNECISSTLAKQLKDQITGPSLNSNTIQILKKLNTKNVIKVVTAYPQIANESLKDAISEEWLLENEEIQIAEDKKIKVKDLIPMLIAQRAEELGFKGDYDWIEGTDEWSELVTADTNKSKEE